MKTAKTILQALALTVIGGAVGVAANSMRRDPLDIQRDYFPARGDGTADDLQSMTLDEVVSAFHDPGHRPGESDSKIFFIDARKEAEFNEGHIRGALQVDHYHLEKYLADVLSNLEAAETIIVYCNGGECEDSILVCRDLIDAKVPHEKIFLFKGGMTAWKDAQHAVE